MTCWEELARALVEQKAADLAVDRALNRCMTDDNDFRRQMYEQLRTDAEVRVFDQALRRVTGGQG